VTFDVSEWKARMVEYLQLVDAGGRLRAGDDVVVTDSDLLKHMPDGFNTNEVALMGEEAIAGAAAAAAEVGGKMASGRVLLTRSRSGRKGIGELRPNDIGTLQSVPALVSYQSKIKPWIRIAAWQCKRCGATHYIQQEGIEKLKQPLDCPKIPMKGDAMWTQSEGGCGRATGTTAWRLIDRKSTRVPIREVEAIEPPEETRGTDQPEVLNVRLIGEQLMEVLELGDYVVFHGILREDNEKNDQVSPDLYFDCHHVEVLNKVDLEISEADEAEIRRLAADNPLEKTLLPSFAPHLVGLDDLKMALILQLFGGVDKQIATDYARGSLQIGVFGDPGVAKTDLQLVSVRLMPRGIYTTASGASRAGLTAAVIPDNSGNGGWKVKAGALVMADRSLCAIDDITQLSKEDYKALEECMQNGTVTTTKAASMKFRARTAVFAAGNRKDNGMWDPERGVQEQTEIPNTTLSRLDLVYVVLQDRTVGDEIAKRILSYHGCGDTPPAPPVSEAFIRKWVVLGKRLNPTITAEAGRTIRKTFSELSAMPKSPFTPRTVKALIRLSQALARVELKDKVEERHALEAVRLHAVGWKNAVEEWYNPNIQVIELGSLTQRERMQVVLSIIEKLSTGGRNALLEDVIAEADEKRITRDQVKAAVDRLCSDGRVYQPTVGSCRVT
jgi:replicative DNA helicase Mcm